MKKILLFFVLFLVVVSLQARDPILHKVRIFLDSSVTSSVKKDLHDIAYRLKLYELDGYVEVQYEVLLTDDYYIAANEGDLVIWGSGIENGGVKCVLFNYFLVDKCEEWGFVGYLLQPYKKANAEIVKDDIFKTVNDLINRYLENAK